MSLDWNARAAPNFEWSEFVTSITGSQTQIAERRAGLEADPAAQAAIRQVAEVCQWVRSLVGAPVRVTSAYRGPRARGSQHDTGHAADLQVDGMSVLDLMGMVYAVREHSPHPLRQVIAESNHTATSSLSRPMARGSGMWLHIAIRTGVWERPSTRPWATSVAPVEGDRVYRTWRPA